MAKIGLGLKSASKLIGIASFAAIGSAWKRRGIARTIPPDGSWDLYARRRGLCQKTKTLKVVPWWGGDEAASGWISNGKAKFPDWSSIWAKEKARQVAAAKYAAMTDQEKKEWNRKCLQRRNSDARQLEKQRAKSKEWRISNPNRVAENHRIWAAANRDKVRALAKKSRSRPKNKAKQNLRDRFKELMRSVKSGGTESFRSFVGCSTAHLQSHLESKFKRGMTWENYGTHWHVDHIIPCAAFDHTKPEQVRQCWHFSNLAPLEAKKNLAKSDQITAPQLSLLLSV
jgi:hypothetical protein